MYSDKIIESIIDLVINQKMPISLVAKQYNIDRKTISKYVNRYRNNETLIKRTRNRSENWSIDEVNKAIDTYYEVGQNLTKTVKKLGYPTRNTLANWLKKYKGVTSRNYSISEVIYTEDEKLEILKIYLKNVYTIAQITRKFGISRETMYNWIKLYLGSDFNMKIKNDKQQINIIDEKEENLLLKSEIEKLKAEQEILKMENEVLKKANEIIKKDAGVNFEFLKNKEKNLIINTLKDKYQIKSLINILNISKSSYYYLNSLKNDKYKDIKEKITVLFESNRKCYGYRRIKECLYLNYNICISEKVVRRLMKELNLIVYLPKRKKYSSYNGETSIAPNNIINRDFSSNYPYEKLLTDVTEFSLADGKVYLSPLIDCFTGSPISYSISKSPNAELVNSMLTKALKYIIQNKTIIHSDRGFHYRTNSFKKLVTENKIIQSMSKKGCSPDNSACEGFFGILKNEFYYCKDWRFVKCKDFIEELSDYMEWFITKRIKKRLNYMSPNDYMIQYLKV